jgi:hypothetical protein
MEINRLCDREWDQAVSKSPYRSFFHKSYWINAVCKQLGGHALLFKSNFADNSWLCPVFAGTPWSSNGFRMGSIGYGGPLPLQEPKEMDEEAEHIGKIYTELERQLKLPCTGFCTYPNANWSCLDHHSNFYLTETEMIPLEGKSEADLFNKVITGNIRTSIRRAEKEGIYISLLEDSRLEEAGTLLRETQRMVGAGYSTPQTFLEQLFSDRRENGVEFWAAQDKNGVLLGMSIHLIYEPTSIHLFHGWRKDTPSLGTNQALIWEMVKSAIKHNCRHFNMGESHSASLKVAKQKWGTCTIPILRLSVK